MTMPCAPRDPKGWIGLPEAMVEIPYQMKLTTNTVRQVTEKRTIEGRRYVLMGTLSRRDWPITIDPVDADLARSLGVLVRNTTNPVKPLRWYPHDAATGNLFSPQATEWDTVPTNGTASGLVTLPDGSIAKVLTHSGSGGVSVGDADGNNEWLVVQPGQPMTFGVWAFGGVNFSGFWRNRDGGTIVSWTSGTTTHEGWQWRTFTITPPGTARMVNLTLNGGSLYARPSAAWGTTAYDLPGRGCPKAIIHDLSEDLTMLTNTGWWGKLGATITEVG